MKYLLNFSSYESFAWNQNKHRNKKSKKSHETTEKLLNLASTRAFKSIFLWNTEIYKFEWNILVNKNKFQASNCVIYGVTYCPTFGTMTEYILKILLSELMKLFLHI